MDKLCCSVCLDQLKDPVTIPCGHNYCMSCIRNHWDGEDQKKVYSCPQCRQTFAPRPALEKNTMLADLVEELKKTALNVVAEEPEYVACDFCTGTKQKALKFCLQCLVSYCEEHLQPHFRFPALNKHKLVAPSKLLQENLCSTDRERNDEHVVVKLSTGEEMTKKHVQQRITDKEKNLKLLTQKELTINHLADKAMNDCETIFTELVHLIEERRSDIKHSIKSTQETEVSRVKKLQDELQQEIAELRSKVSELEQPSCTSDYAQSQSSYPLVSHLDESSDSSSLEMPPQNFEDVTASVTEFRRKLKDVLSEIRANVLLRETDLDVLVPQAAPKSKDEFQLYLCEITLNQNTAHRQMCFDGRKKVYRYITNLDYRQATLPDRFIDFPQILCRESLTGRCYWEVEVRGSEVFVAVAYKDIRRKGDDSVFGNNDKSWALECFDNGFEFRHNKIRTYISGHPSSRVGVYLDHSAGVLSFYSVSETMMLLHTVQTTFTQPLCPGFGIHADDSSAELFSLLVDPEENLQCYTPAW